MIKIPNHLKLCLADATLNFKWSGNNQFRKMEVRPFLIPLCEATFNF